MVILADIPVRAIILGNTGKIQGLAKEWSTGCVIPAFWPPLAAGAHFTQPRAQSLANPCTEMVKNSKKYVLG